MRTVNLPMMMAYRSSEHETTKASPHSLMFGRELCLPIDHARPTRDKIISNHKPLCSQLQEHLENAYHQTANFATTTS